MSEDPKVQIALRARDSSPILSGSPDSLVARGRRELADLALQTQTLAQTRLRAEQGDAAAQYELCWLITRQEESEGEAEADMWLRKAAGQGHPKAQYCVGILLFLNSSFQTEGLDAKRNSEAAVWFRKAAEQGYACAQYALGMALRDGQGIPQDSVEAAVWFQKAAEQGVFALLDGWQP